MIIQDLQGIINNQDLEQEEKRRQVLEKIAAFYIDRYQAESDEVALFFPNELKTALKFVYPFYLSQADEIPINSKKPIVSRIYRSALSFLDNELVDKERLFQYEFIKNYDDEARIIWKMMGSVITFDQEKIGVIQVSRKRASFQSLGPDFTSEDLEFLEKSVAQLAPFLNEIRGYRVY